MSQSGDVFAKDVEFYIDYCAWLDVLEVGIFERVGYDVHLEGVVCRVAHRQTCAVDCYAAFIHGEITPSRHFLVRFVFEGKDSASVGVLHCGALCCLVHMPLHDVSVETSVHLHGTLYIHFIAYPKFAEIGAQERFAHGGGGVGLSVEFGHCEANAVVCHTLVDVQFFCEGALEGEMYVVLLLFYRHDFRHGFYYS